MSWLLQYLDKNSPNPSTRLELSEQVLSPPICLAFFPQIIHQLSHNRLPSDSKVLNTFCDVIFQWMSASNFKVGYLLSGADISSVSSVCLFFCGAVNPKVHEAFEHVFPLITLWYRMGKETYFENLQRNLSRVPDIDRNSPLAHLMGTHSIIPWPGEEDRLPRTPEILEGLLYFFFYTKH